MAQLLVSDPDERTIAWQEKRARLNGHFLQDEVKALPETTAVPWTRPNP